MNSLWDAFSSYFASAGPSVVLRLDLLAVLMVALLVPVIGLVCVYLRDHHGTRTNRQ